jgi:hypothetical protein
LALLAFLLFAQVAVADGLEREMLKQAPRLLEQLRKKGYQNVGVLKFRVQKGKGSLSDSAGPINLTAARCLELALVLANDVEKPLGIIQDASAVAARLRGASYLTEAGRRKLFAARYPLAWGNQQVAADAFLTGVVRIKSKLKDLTVDIQAFGKAGGAPRRVAQFTATMSAAGLAESGESFLLRGAFEGGKVEVVEAKAVQVAARVKSGEAKYPLADSAAPVALEIYYGRKQVEVKTQNGQARIREPRRGQKVTFVLRRRVRSKERYGVVLKVNGENTLYRQRLKDVECRKWILDPGDPPSAIEGFQKDGKTAGEFRILSRAESKDQEVYYGEDVGTISLVVFREQRDRNRSGGDLSYEAEDLAVLQRGLFPRKKPLNLAALQFQLREDGSRGLIGEGEKVESKVRHVSFTPDPVPVMTATITYYRP